MSAAEVARLTPGVRPGSGGVVFWDGQLADDARLVVALARTAAAFGARVLTGARVTGVDGAGAAAAPTPGPVHAGHPAPVERRERGRSGPAPPPAGVVGQLPVP